MLDVGALNRCSIISNDGGVSTTSGNKPELHWKPGCKYPRAQVRSTAWTLAQLLALTIDEELSPMRNVAPWRMDRPLTAGLVAQWLRIEFTGLPFRDGFDRKSQKFCFPKQRGDPRLRL